MKRFTVAVIFFPLFYLLVSFPHPVLFSLFIAVISSMGLYEFYRMYFKEISFPILVLGEFLSFILLSGFYLKGVSSGVPPFTLSFSLTFMVLLFLSLHLLIDRKSFFLSVSVMGMGLIYVSWLLGHLVLLRNLDRGILLVFFLAMVTWGTDAGALFAGKLVGKRKLAPTISPNKTIEGALGGLLTGVLMGVLSKFWFLPFIPLKEIAGLGVLLSVSGQTGDLVESMFKRANQMKDSGNLLPGHGGILDKIDSFVFSGPVLYYYLILFPTA